MNWDEFAGHWTQTKGKLKEKWGRLTDNDLAVISGRRVQMAGLLQKKYGLAHEQAEVEIDQFTRNLK
jgi:uncharacterized protein YjbJ (UPF0337 family)